MNQNNKQSLALRYFPNAKPKTAVRHLMAWIKRCQPLVKELEKLGYEKYQKSLTQKEIELISDYIGDP